MNIVNIQNIPNQKFSFNADGFAYTVQLRTSDGVTLADVAIDGVIVCTSTLCVPSGWLIPFPYMRGSAGNLRFVCVKNEYPYYEKFGNTQTLYYYSAAEMESLNDAQ